MIKKVIAIAAICMFFASFNAVYSQNTLKVGIVDSETIAKQLPEAQDADKKLADIRKKALDTLEQKQNALKARIENYQKQKSMMNADAQKKEEESLTKAQQEFMQYREFKEQEFGQVRDQLYEPIRETVRKAIAEVAKEEKYQLVLDKSNNPTLLYFEDKAEITFRVLDKLKRGSK